MNFIPKLWKNTKMRPDIMRVANPVSGSVLSTRLSTLFSVLLINLNNGNHLKRMYADI